MTNDHITTLIATLKTDLINSLQSKGITSDQTISQIKISSNGNQQQLQIPGYLQIVEKGRGPTSSNPVPGDPPMIQRIQQWCREKGIPESQPLGDANINSRLNQSTEQIAGELLTQILNSINI